MVQRLSIFGLAEVLVTGGPYRDQGTHRRLGVLEAADLDEALAWARKGAMTRAPVEVREILLRPAPAQAPGASR